MSSSTHDDQSAFSFTEQPLSLTAQRLFKEYPAVITLSDVAKIFDYNVQTARRFYRTGKFPFLTDISHTSERRFNLTDVINYLDSPTPTPFAKKRGRPVGSKNKSKSVPATNA